MTQVSFFNNTWENVRKNPIDTENIKLGKYSWVRNELKIT